MSKIPKKYILSVEEKMDLVKDMSKEQIWDIDLLITIDNEAKALIGQGMEALDDLNKTLLKFPKSERAKYRPVIQAHLHTIETIKKTYDENQDTKKEYDRRLMDLINKSDNKVAEKGVPVGLNFDAEMITELFYKPNNIEKFKGGLRGKNEDGEELSEEEIEKIVKYCWMQVVPLMVDLMHSKFGEHFQAKIRRLKKKLNDATLRIASLQKGRKYTTEKDLKVIPYLKTMWDDNLPLGDNQKSWYGKIHKETGVGFETIRAINKKWKDDWKDLETDDEGNILQQYIKDIIA